MGVHLLVFIGVSAIVILLPGPDTMVVTKNVLLHGRRSALATSVGVCTGLSLWTLAAALGIASLVRASSVAFTTLKLAGALYLTWLGIQAWRSARQRPQPAGTGGGVAAAPASAGTSMRQGVLSNLGNPKIGVFFTSLLPQFVDAHHATLVPFLLLGGVFVAMTLAWLCTYSLLASRAALTLQRPRVRAMLDRITGTVLIAIGLRLAVERR